MKIHHHADFEYISKAEWNEAFWISNLWHRTEPENPAWLHKTTGLKLDI